jgi:hypothetical protein
VEKDLEPTMKLNFLCKDVLMSNHKLFLKATRVMETLIEVLRDYVAKYVLLFGKRSY